MDLEYKIEIATTDFNTTKAAVEGGANRIELCCGLAEGGLTPSLGQIKMCRELFTVQLFPIIRPRAGDFLYNDEEFDIMLEDVKLSKQLDCDGVVIGILNKDGSIDVERVEKLIETAYPLEVTFHRAFDRCRDPFEALEQLINIGCSRILTSGQQPTAPLGIELIRKLVEAADERIIIMPGSGVRPDNIIELAERTKAREFHTSLRSKIKSKMDYIHPAFALSEESYSNHHIDSKQVKELKKILADLQGNLTSG